MQSQSGFHKAQEDRESSSVIVNLSRENTEFDFQSDTANFENNIEDCAIAAKHLIFSDRLIDYRAPKTTFKHISHLEWCIFRPTQIRYTIHPTF